MAKSNPVMYVASGRQALITRRKITAQDRRYGASVYGQSYHETWDAAHAALIVRCEADLQRKAADLAFAQSMHRSAERALAKAKAMKPPQEDA